MLDAITQYILTLVPAFTAVVGMITTLGVAIGKIKQANKDATAEIKEAHADNRALRKQMAEVMMENKELKQDLKKITARMAHMYFIEDDNPNNKEE